MSELLTIPETAERLGITVKAVEKRIERGTIQSLRRDGRRVVPGAEVRRVVEQGKPQASQGFPREGTETLLSGDLAKFLERLETLAAENGRFKALQEVNEAERDQLRNALFEERAKVAELEDKLALQQTSDANADISAEVATVTPRRRLFRRR